MGKRKEGQRLDSCIPNTKGIAIHLKEVIVLLFSGAPELSEFICHVSTPHGLLLRVTENMELQLSRSEVQEVAVDLGTLAAIQKNTGFIPREKKKHSSQPSGCQSHEMYHLLISVGSTHANSEQIHMQKHHRHEIN